MTKTCTCREERDQSVDIPGLRETGARSCRSVGETMPERKGGAGWEAPDRDENESKTREGETDHRKQLVGTFANEADKADITSLRFRRHDVDYDQRIDESGHRRRR